eukprot:gene23147-29512_t
MEEALNISKLQKQTFARRRSSVRQDAKEFSARQQQKQQPAGSGQNSWQSSRAASCNSCYSKSTKKEEGGKGGPVIT